MAAMLHQRSGEMFRPFGLYAGDLQSRGLAVMPLGGDDGKVALKAGYPRWRTAPGAKTVAQWSIEHADANIGVLCALSRIVAVDIDAANLLPSMLDRFGETPLIIATRRGYQLWYRARGDERPANLRKGEGLEVEIKAGRAAIVVVPPSWNRATGHPYRFERGSWDDLAGLPLFPPAQASQTSPALSASVEALFRNHIGVRNISLFNYLRLNFSFVSVEQIEAEALWFNETYQIEPESRVKVLATAHSVWNYMMQCGLTDGSDAYLRIPLAELDALKAYAGALYPQALALHIELKRQHGARVARGEPFIISAHAMSDSRVIPGLTSRKRIEQVRRAAEEAGLLLKIRAAGRELGQFRAALYTFGRLPAPEQSNDVKLLKPKKD